MNLLHLIAKLDPEKGGVGQAVRTIAAELSELGLYNEIVCLDAPGSPFLLNEALVVQTKGPGKGPWCFSPDLIPYLLERLEQFDAVIVHGLWLYHSYALKTAMNVLRRRKIEKYGKANLPRLFIMPHGMLDPYFQKASGRKLKAIRNWAYWKLVEKNLVNEADGLLFTCEAERRLAKEPFIPYKPKRETVIGLGVEEPPEYNVVMQQAFAVRCMGLKDQKYILYLGRINEKKGIDLLIDAFAMVIAKVKEDKLFQSFLTVAHTSVLPKLVIAGPGLDTSYGKYIQQKAASHKVISSDVYFTGMLKGEAKWGALHNCEAFILPSHQENFGIAVVEALACGKPVLISNQVNIWQEIEEGRSGLIAPDTLQGTEKLLLQIFSMTADEKREMSTRARSCYKNKFAVKPVAEKLFEELRS